MLNEILIIVMKSLKKLRIYFFYFKSFINYIHILL